MPHTQKHFKLNRQNIYGKDIETAWYNGKCTQERSRAMSYILVLRTTHSLTLVHSHNLFDLKFPKPKPGSWLDEPEWFYVESYWLDNLGGNICVCVCICMYTYIHIYINIVYRVDSIWESERHY